MTAPARSWVFSFGAPFSGPGPFVPPPTKKVSVAEERVFGRGILRVNGDWRVLVGLRIRTSADVEVLRTRLENRLLSGRNGWYHRPGKGVGMQEFQGRPLNAQRRREIFNRLDSFVEDPAVIAVRDKEVVAKRDSKNRAYASVSCTIVTREGELRFTDRDAFEIGM